MAKKRTINGTLSRKGDVVGIAPNQWTCLRDTLTVPPGNDWATKDDVNTLRAELDAMSDAFGELASEFEADRAQRTKESNDAENISEQ